MNGVSQSAECVKQLFLKSSPQQSRAGHSPCSLFKVTTKHQFKKKNPIMEMKKKLLRNACQTPKPYKKNSIFLTTPSRSVSLLSSRDGKNIPSRDQTSRSPASRDLYLSIFDKCVKNSGMIINQASSIDCLLKANADSIKEFQLSGILRKMKQIQRLCQEIQDKLVQKEIRSVSPFRLERKKLVRKDLKKIVKNSRYPAQKKIFELVKRFLTGLPKKLKESLLFSAKRIRKSLLSVKQNREFSIALQFSGPLNLCLLPSLIKNSLKCSQQFYSNQQKNGLFDLLLFQTLARVKLPFSAQALTLYKKEKQTRQAFQNKASTFTTKIQSGVTSGSLALLRGEFKQSQFVLNEVLKIIHKQLLKSKRDKTKSLLRKYLKSILTWLGWSAYLSGQLQKAKVFFQQAAHKGESNFKLILEYGLFLVNRGLPLTSKISESSEDNKFLQLLKYVHYEGKQLASELETLERIFTQCPSQFKDMLLLATLAEVGSDQEKSKKIIDKCESNLESVNPSLRSHFYLKKVKREKESGIRKAIVERKDDNLVLLYYYLKAQIKEKTQSPETITILEQLQELFRGAGANTSKLLFWKGRYYALEHRHRLASKLFKEAFEQVSEKKKEYIRWHRVEVSRLEEIIKIAALNRDTIRKSAPAFSDLEPFWEELLRLCLNRNQETLQFQLFHQKYTSRFQASFLLWYAMLKSNNSKSLQRARTLVSEMASSSASYDQDFLQVDDSLLFRLMQSAVDLRGKNYGDELTREQFLAIVDLKTTIKERDLILARTCVSHLISLSSLPILHYFALSIAQKQAKLNISELDLENIERVSDRLSQHFLKTQDWANTYHRAKSALLWGQILYLAEEEQVGNNERGWRGPYKRARDLLVAQTKEEVLRSASRAIDYSLHKYKL